MSNLVIFSLGIVSRLSLLPKALGCAAPLGGGTIFGFRAGARSHVVRNLLSEECGGHGHLVSRKRWWMQGQVPMGKGVVEETVDIKAWWLILQFLLVSVIIGEAAPMVFWSDCRECLLSWMRSCGRTPSAMTVVETYGSIIRGSRWPTGEAGSIGGIPQWVTRMPPLCNGGVML